ncbi:hypothetical protein HNR55_002823 [Acetobacter lovaniensis]|uniref:DUF2285 domain-containing protein n=2 Tax=Acetobacterales TaxID=3120395 RepID=A0A841QIF1_9PROT|nr:hypothetical protein [Acetobacter lovaniensis]
MCETDEKIRAGNAKGGCYVGEFNDIDSSLAILVFGDEGLRFAECGRQFRLRHTSGLARFRKERLQQKLPGCAQGFLHAEQLSDGQGSRSDNPDLGLSHFRIWLTAILLEGCRMTARPELDPDVDDLAPTVPTITTYDEVHFITYLRLLDAEADRADWTEVARIVLHRDPADGERTRICWESHLVRAQWMTKIGYRKILEQAVIDARATRH